MNRVEAQIRGISLKPMSDQRLAYGHGFLDQIKKYIAHAHVFMPLVTPNSNQGQWVHQEIGFAAALNVPVFPVCVGQPPMGMIQTSHSLCLQSDDDPELERRLTREAFDSMISWVARNSQPYFECAEEVEERALMLAEYADQVRSIDGPHLLRQEGGLSSFSIPNEHAGHRVWRERWGIKPRPRFSYKCLRKEQQALEEHAREAGCQLIIQYGLDLDAEHGPGAKYSRLRVDRFPEINGRRQGADRPDKIRPTALAGFGGQLVRGRVRSRLDADGLPKHALHASRGHRAAPSARV